MAAVTRNAIEARATARCQLAEWVCAELNGLLDIFDSRLRAIDVRVDTARGLIATTPEIVFDKVIPLIGSGRDVLRNKDIDGLKKMALGASEYGDTGAILGKIFSIWESAAKDEQRRAWKHAKKLAHYSEQWADVDILASSLG